MATSIASTFLYKPPPSSLLPPISTSKPSSTAHHLSAATRRSISASPRASAAPTSGMQSKGRRGGERADERVRKVHTVEEFESALRSAGSRLVVVEYAASDSDQSRKMYPFMVELSRTCGDVEFLVVMGDESRETEELCRREKVDKVPHFSFYKGMEKVHEEEGIGPDQLMGDVLYYGDSHSSVVQLHSRQASNQLRNLVDRSWRNSFIHHVSMMAWCTRPTTIFIFFGRIQYSGGT